MLNKKEEKIVWTFVSVAPMEAVLHELEHLMEAFRRASEEIRFITSKAG